MASRQLDEEAVFHIARKLEDPNDREKYLDQICAGDQGLRSRVENLLKVYDKEQEFLQSSSDPGSTVEQPPITERPGTIIGRYRLMEQIGEGGMGVVFVAEQERPFRRKVALKIVKPGMDTREVVARFEAERQALALMDHPNIAKVLDAGSTESGRAYFVMELVRGVPLTEYCDQNKLSVHERLPLFIQICQAIQHAHQKGIIHRDVKPHNVLVTLHDGQPVPKVIDFGVAKAVNQRLTDRTIYTQFAQIIGTPIYMSPEQAELSGLDIDTRSDIYSLGVLLYELLTGTTPFDKERFERATYDEIRRIVREEEPPKPSTKISTLGKTAVPVSERRNTNPQKLQQFVRGDLDWIVMKALEKDRTRRYETATSFAADVARYLSDEPIEARPPSTAYRLRKAASRHRSALAATAVVVLTLIVATVASSWMAMRAIREAQRAREAEERYRGVLADLWGELADRAMDSAFSGDLAGTQDAIDKAGIAGAPDDLLQTLGGLAFFFGGKHEEAIDRLKKALVDNPNSLSALSALWWAYRNSYDLSNMYRVEKTIKERQLEPTTRHEHLFVCLIQSVSSSSEHIGGVIARLDSLIQERERWGAAYAIRATARQEQGLESMELDDFRQAVNDYGKAELLLHDTPFLLSMGLSILTDGIELAEQQGNSTDAKDWRRRAEGIAAKLDQRPNYKKGRHEIAVFCQVTGQFDRAKEAEQALLNLGGANACFTEATAALRNHQSLAIEAKLRAQSGSYEALICLANVLSEKSDEGRNEAMEIFHKLQQQNIELGAKVLALNIALLAGQPDESREASRQLLRTNALSQEWRWFKYVTEYYAKEMDENELLRRAGPFSGSRCVANYAIAMEALALGDREKAKKHFGITVNTGRAGWYDHLWAQAFLRRLNESDTWPDWIPRKDGEQ